MLDKLLANGIRYLFVSNSDNLGARLDPALLGYFSMENLPFMMEVADRTPADRKGGHLARLKEGGFVLRESAQCPPEDMEAFQDVKRHRYFNTNNLWINASALKSTLARHEGILGLPMIRNAKTVDPRDPASTKVFQLETAMGAAIGIFEGAGAIRVPRVRFAPVKTTNELLAVQSDAYEMQADFSLALHHDREGQPCIIDLDRRYYKTVDDLNRRFPRGAPSLINCTSLTVEGDIRFGARVCCTGEVKLVNRSEKPVAIEGGASLEGTCSYP
jgi:UDP-N-acetylglucosamine pyrophosphorylase